ncbi:NDP-hexose 2,3-dehydratase family protein [Streptomyces radicis]|uniref:NDP-hexose 2,3-dehydratase n=1 Tax=Streptomyces radicis TaxID=1750517 RepID=A0A3A9WUQ4_9ACTN|nr:NDP-hexose 2,3-dehydratase family protein [Streptomyces radicis]RKN11536.1 NDP-hexose 2,3-dehydratase [Streptomyces radicis]RKN26446.1 NDP-hexose 2,3-dehydratase [Streptomyces radicis]
MPPSASARPQENTESRVIASALSRGPDGSGTARFLAERERVASRRWTRTTRVPLAELTGWHCAPGAAAFTHESGGFFAVEGLSVHAEGAAVPRWHQPIIHQPEVGILGILAREFDGTLRFLMQLKAEPGNAGGLQLSPTVQATRSNYLGLHRGRPVPYLEHFRNPDPERVLVDVRQSEQGAWFLRKHNRNMVVEATEDVPVLDGFHWLTLGQLEELLFVDDLVNMDTRTVLACLPRCGPPPAGADALAGDAFTAALWRSLDPRQGALHPMRSILSWLTGTRTGTRLTAERVPLTRLPGWERDGERLYHRSGRFFEIVGMRVEAAGREVGGWDQPMLAVAGTGLLALLVTRINGVLHALMHLRPEPGLRDVAELAPTVQCHVDNYDALPRAARPRFLDVVLDADPAGVRFDTRLSDEGGRFDRVGNRHLVIETERLPEPPSHRWMPVHQLGALVDHSGYLNVQARSLLACLHALAAHRPAPTRGGPRP